jgi:hypothetical protein
MLYVKVQNIGVVQEFHADSVAKGGMPGDALAVKVCRYFTVVADGEASSCCCRPCGPAVQDLCAVLPGIQVFTLSLLP